jgi:glycosyltransferase involved in cell wall biosynthesis
MKLLSFVIPAFNEAQNLPVLYERITAIDWAILGFDIEIIIVDDHSTDGTSALLTTLRERDQRLKWLRFSRNFGSHVALAAGIEHARGDVISLLAADLQDPPEIVPSLLERWQAGGLIVWAARDKVEGVSFSNRIFSRLYYRMMRWFALPQMPKEGADFLIFDRRVADALNQARERNTSILALIQWLGFSQEFVPYTKQSRASGRSKWTLSKKIKLVIDSMVGFSYAPIRLMSGLGVSIAMLGLLYAALLFVLRFVYLKPVEGWTSLICVVLVTSGIQLLMLGVLGEYLWRNFDETRGRPRYIVESRVGLTDSPPSS